MKAIYEKAFREKAQLRKKSHLIELRVKNKKIEVYIDKKVWWLDSSKNIIKFMNKFSKAFIANPKIKLFKIKMDGKHRQLNVKQIKFNDIMLADYHYKLTL